MTFLLFLAGLALLEYIVGRKSRAGVPTTKERKGYLAESTNSAGLLSLAQAVEQPDGTPTDSTPDHKQVVHKSGSDGV